MKKITNVFEDRYGGAVLVYEDGSTERLTRETFKENSYKFDYLPGVSAMLGQWTHEEDNEREKRENRERCKRIAEELDELAGGVAYKCPHCCEAVDRDEVEESEHENEDGETVCTCPNCGAELGDVEELEEYSLYDYFSDCLDIEYRIDSDGDLRGVSVMVSCGGPNIFVDTEKNAVRLYWWGNYAEYPIDSTTGAAIDEIFTEYYEMLRG